MKLAILLLALILANSAYALRRAPERPQVVGIRVDPANPLHVFAVLELRNPTRFHVQLPARPVAESQDGGSIFYLAERNIIPPSFVDLALTGCVRYVLTPSTERTTVQVLWRSDDGGLTWNETQLRDYIQHLENESAARAEALLHAQVLWRLSQTRWREYLFFAIIGVYLVLTSALLFRRDWFGAASALSRTALVCLLLYFGLTMVEQYQCWMEGSNASLPAVCETVLAITGQPFVYMAFLAVVLLFLPNAMELGAVYCGRRVRQMPRVLAIWQLGAVILWSLIAFAVSVTQHMLYLT